LSQWSQEATAPRTVALWSEGVMTSPILSQQGSVIVCERHP